MLLFTSNFRKDSTNPRGIAVSRVTPPWFHGPSFKDLEPRGRWLELPEEQFRPLYAGLLAALDPLVIAKRLGEGAVMLCWERADQFCHRQMVAEWMRAAGVEVEEKQGIYGRTRQMSALLF